MKRQEPTILSRESKGGQDYWPKFHHIVPIYVAIGTVTVVGLMVVRWAFAEYLPGVEIKEEIWEVWIPMIFPVIPVAIWLRPRIRILDFDARTDDRQFLLLTLSVLSIAFPSMFAQNAILEAVGDLHQVNDVDAIDPQRPDQYYAISEFQVLQNQGGLHADVRPSGRTNERLNFDFYFAFPIIGHSGENGSIHKYWYGIKYHQQISNRLTNEKKQWQYKLAYDHGVEMANSHDFGSQEYFEVVQASNDRDGYRKAVESRSGVSWENDTVILIPGVGAFQDRTGKKFDWIVITSGIGLAVFLAILVVPGYDEDELRRQRRGEMPASNLLDSFKEFFIPRNDWFAAPILLDAIIIVYLVQVFSGLHPISPTGGELLEWGANRRTETMGGDWWRLVTSMFLHGGLMHLALNAYGLLLAAVYVEPIFGRLKLFAIFFVSGICGSLASIWWYANTVSVGASGAIFGLFGAIFSLAAMGVVRFRELTWLWFFLGINLLFGLTGGIDNAAHLGGFVSGVFIGVILQVFTRIRPEQSVP